MFNSIFGCFSTKNGFEKTQITQKLTHRCARLTGLTGLTGITQITEITGNTGLTGIT